MNGSRTSAFGYWWLPLGYWLLAIGCWTVVSGAVSPLPAQSLPPYAPLNPAAQMRSGLATLPYFTVDRRWHVSFAVDYGSLIEYHAGEGASYVLDAEVLGARLLVARSIGTTGFVLAETSFYGSYDGFLDGFLDWYHNFTGLHVAARELRPKDEFAYEIRLGGREFQYAKSSGFIGDVRVGGGFRHGRGWQTAAWLTLPTGSTPGGYRKGVLSANAMTMLHHDFGKGNRFTYEGSAGFGYTPHHGELRQWQHTTFLMVAQGLRARIVGPFQGYANIIYDTPYYRDTGIPDLDRKELTLDAGALFRFKRGPAWLLGMTQDLSPKGPAIDVAFRLGAYW